MPGYGDSFASVNEGAEADQNILNNYYHNQAQNALTQMYGPIAGNPQAALQLQNYNYLQAQNPQFIQQQAIANNQAQTNLNYDQANNPIRLQNNQGQANVSTATGQTDLQTQPSTAARVNAENTAAAGVAVPTANANLAVTQAQADAVTASQHVAGVASFNSAASDWLASHPGDAEGAFQAGKAAALNSGANPADVNQSATALHDKFVADPQGTINALGAQAIATQRAAIAKMNPLDYQKAQLEIAKTHGALVDQAQKNYSTAKETEDSVLNSSGPLGTQISGLHAGQDALANAEKLVNSLPSNAGYRKLTEVLPGSTVNQLRDYAKQIGAALSLDQMTAIRESTGGAGSGIRNAREFAAAGEALANIDPDNMTPDQLRQQIANARAYLTNAQTVAEGYLARNNNGYAAAVQRRQAAESDLNSAQGLYTLQPSAGVPAGATPPAAAPNAANGAAAVSAPASPNTPGGAGAVGPTGGASGSWENAPTPPPRPTDGGAAPSGGPRLPATNSSTGYNKVSYDIEDTAPEAPVSTGASARWAAGMLPTKVTDDYPMPHAANVNTAGLKPAFKQSILQLQQDAAAAGIPTKVVSGYRDNALQAKLYANYQSKLRGQPLPYPDAGQGGVAAPPGRSYHNFGEAADIVALNPRQQAAFTQLARNPKYGIKAGADFGDFDHYYQGVAPEGQLPGASGKGAAPSAAPSAATTPAVYTPPAAAPSAPATTPATYTPTAPQNVAPPASLDVENRAPQNVAPQQTASAAPAQTAPQNAPGQTAPPVYNAAPVASVDPGVATAVARAQFEREVMPVMSGRALLAKYLRQPQSREA